jgi:hypothetical protein
MAARRWRNMIERWIGKAPTKTRVRTAAIVVRHPVVEDLPHVAFVE